MQCMSSTLRKCIYDVDRPFGVEWQKPYVKIKEDLSDQYGSFELADILNLQLSTLLGPKV